jgi:transketolase
MNESKAKKKIIKKKIEYFQYAYQSNSIHIGPSLSVFEILNVLYYVVMNKDDRFILSKGHACLPLYQILKDKKIIDQEDIENYYTNNSRLRGLADISTPGVHVTGGSLGHGLSVASGWAYGKKFKKEKGKIYCLIGDGEANEGSIWEAIWFSAQQKLSNLVLIIDKNNLQALRLTNEIMDLNLERILDDERINLQSINGHCLSEIKDSLSNTSNEKFNIIIANTIKGNSISFIENVNSWHYGKITKKECDAAIVELNNQLESIQ